MFIVFTYWKSALCHTAYVIGRAQECQEFRRFMASQSKFNPKIYQLLVGIFQQGWYQNDQKR